MSHVKTLAIPYHDQLDPLYCGSACVQMVVEGGGGTSPSQHVLYTDAHTHGVLDPSTNWSSPPDGMNWTLDKVLGANTFDLVSVSSEAALTRKIVWSIFKNSTPGVALVYGLGHWVTVVGYDITANPTKATDTAYDINTIDVHDPWRTQEEGLPPPPPPPNHVLYKDWTRHYLEPVQRGYWAGKLLALGNFGAAARSHDISVDLKDSGRDAHVDAVAPSLVPPDAALAGAMAGLTKWGLTTRSDWRPVLVPGFAPLEPLLVQRLDNPDFYYLVPIGSADPRIVRAVVRVDAATGEYLEARPVTTVDTADHKSWGTTAADFATEATTRSKIAGQYLPLPGLDGRILARPEGLGVHPAFVWRPCQESLSPILPFRLITIGDRTYYQRLDGVLFDSLHDPTPGN
jgi:hypothetical protein